LDHAEGDINRQAPKGAEPLRRQVS
jgi:hypothetical protein